MNIDLIDLRDKYIEVEISGGNFHKGILVDFGLDIVVIFDCRNNTFLYIPFVHIQQLREVIKEEETFYTPPLEKPNTSDSISYRKKKTKQKRIIHPVGRRGWITQFLL
ncbi:hypothetical protein KW850_14935 [Bacillus sp. sid0103]|uniref:hypothetical protein n=1 Tax=Bacillus sp. sid0103 TaxID=2856337 RepID=UPI001C4448A8|nr:hypothetical protein [Bacillus sp. sid0103]MBV7506558.1 hypothetical protein [Bacillus sp. sid0103]